MTALRCKGCDWPLERWSANEPHLPGCDGGTLTTPCDCDLGPLCGDCFIEFLHKEVPGQEAFFVDGAT